MAKKPTHPQKKKTPKRPTKSEPISAPPVGNENPVPTGIPQFGQPTPSADPTQFVIKHGSDTQAYKILDSQKQYPRPFPLVAGTDEPSLTFQDALGSAGQKIVSDIQKAGQIVFHSVGDTGNVKGPDSEDTVSDKMVSDFDDTNPRQVPSFLAMKSTALASRSITTISSTTSTVTIPRRSSPLQAITMEWWRRKAIRRRLLPSSRTSALPVNPRIVRRKRVNWFVLLRFNRAFTTRWTLRSSAFCAFTAIAWKIQA